MKDKLPYFIAGAGGMIGSSLARSFKLNAENVIKADVWEGDVDDDCLFLDLASDPPSWIFPQRIRTAYICAGITKLDACRSDPIGSYLVNVDGTLKLIEMMIDRGAFVVFLSSNQVFDGAIPYISAEESHNPISEYGRQKAAVEKILMQIPEQVAIVRLSKVIGANSIFSTWAKALNSKQTIHPLTDMVVSPVLLKSVVSVLKIIGVNKLRGVWQISGDQDISYSDAAYLGARNLGADEKLIKPCTTSNAGLDLENNPANTTMDISRLKNIKGVEIPSVKYTIKKAFSLSK